MFVTFLVLNIVILKDFCYLSKYCRLYYFILANSADVLYGITFGSILFVKTPKFAIQIIVY